MLCKGKPECEGDSDGVMMRGAKSGCFDGDRRAAEAHAPRKFACLRSLRSANIRKRDYPPLARGVNVASLRAYLRARDH